jgi:RNA polymerase sigma factor (sigma-70 family)
VSRTVLQLTTAIARGDGDAFTVFFRERFDEMYADAKRATGRDESFCLDVVQDSMLRVIRSMKPMDSERHLRAWLKRTVQSCAYDAIRKDMRRARRERAIAPPWRPSGASDDEQRVSRLWEEMVAQGGLQATLLVMRYRLGWTLQRIGDAVGMGPGAVDGKIRRSILGMRRRAKESSHE